MRHPSRALYVYDGKMSHVGIDAVVRRQLAALVSSGWSVDLVSRGRANLAGVTDHCARYTIANLISWLPRKYYYPAQKRYLSLRASRFLAQQKYGAVISWPQRGLRTFRKAAAQGVPCFLNCDTVHYKMGRRPDRVARWPEFSPADFEAEYALSTRILAPSDFSRDTFLQNGVSPAKLVVIGRGVDTERFQSAPVEDSARPFRVVFCGRVSERKGIRQIIQAWKLAALPGAELWIIGEISDEVAGFLEAERRREITLFGFRHDAEKLLPQCDAQILLSRHEGQAKGLLEGAACGLATLATPHCGFPMRENENGFSVAREDIEDVAQKLRRLYEDRAHCRTLGRNARAMILADYSWDSFARRFLTAIESGCAEQQ